MYLGFLPQWVGVLQLSYALGTWALPLKGPFCQDNELSSYVVSVLCSVLAVLATVGPVIGRVGVKSTSVRLAPEPGVQKRKGSALAEDLGQYNQVWDQKEVACLG